MLIRTFLAVILNISLLQLQAADIIALRGRLFLPPDQPGKPIGIYLRENPLSPDRGKIKGVRKGIVSRMKASGNGD
jgi:hypothetical protein